MSRITCVRRALLDVASLPGGALLPARNAGHAAAGQGWRGLRLTRALCALALGLALSAGVLGNAIGQRQAHAAANAPAVAFQVDSVTSWVNTGAGRIDRSCDPTMPFTFLGIITFPAGNPGGTLQYFWGRIGISAAQGGGDQPVQNITIQPGQTELMVYDTWDVSAALGNGQILWDKLYINAPGFLSSNQTEISLVCGFSVTSATGAVSQATWCPGPSLIIRWVTFTFTFNLSVNPSPGGTIGYSITQTLPNGTHPSNSPIPGSTSAAPGAPTANPVTSTWTLVTTAATGTYSEVLSTTSPNGVTSNTVTLTKTC